MSPKDMSKVAQQLYDEAMAEGEVDPSAEARMPFIKGAVWAMQHVPERKPLTDEQIRAAAIAARLFVHPRKLEIRLGTDASMGLDSTAEVNRLVRAIEAAHGIKERP